MMVTSGLDDTRWALPGDALADLATADEAGAEASAPDIASKFGPVESPHVDQRARGQQVASVPIHSLRRPGVIARQETILSGPGESLTIVHDTVDPALAYAPGIRVALAAARDARGVTVGLDALIDLGLRPRRAQADVEKPIDEGGVPGQVARATGA